MDPLPLPQERVDMAVVGAGAAGLATAILAARRMPGRSIVALDSAARLGAKILVAGGGRCNVTNRVVRPADFCGTSPHAIKNVLAAFTVPQTVAFFREMGVELREEENGKLFPVTDRAQTVLDALLGEARGRGVRLLTGQRVMGIEGHEGGFQIVTQTGSCSARRVVLATGGRSLPKTGSDGGGYELARHLGHSLIPTTPALVPLVLEGEFHKPLSGISHEAAITVRAGGGKPVRLTGSMLWTHFGVSGPVVLNASRYWHRALIAERTARVSANLMPADDFAAAERKLMELSSRQPKLLLHNALAAWLPARLADAVLGHLGINPDIPMVHLSREIRRRLAHALLDWPLPVKDSRGYSHAEATAGGVPLTEIDPATMASRRCQGLYLVGEILDVDGRIGGFNFQWAWSSAYVAAAGLAAT